MSAKKSRGTKTAAKRATAKRATAKASPMGRSQGHHQHDTIKHRHKHYHVPHYLHRGENWAHLLSTHRHEHNRAELEHVHIPHTDVEK